MSNHDHDRPRPDSRRAFLRALVAGSGGLVFGANAFGQSLLVRGEGQVALPATVSATASASYLRTRTFVRPTGFRTASFTSPFIVVPEYHTESVLYPRTRTETWRPPQPGTVTVGTVTITAMIGRTVIVTSRPTTHVDYTRSHDRHSVTESRWFGTATAVATQGDSMTASYTTTREKSWFGNQGTAFVEEGEASGEELEAIVAMDAGVDLFDPRTRAEGAFDLDFARVRSADVSR